MNVARSAYKAITTHCSQLQYEMEMACDSAKNVEIGNKNHSRKFSAAMTEYFYKVLQDQMAIHLNIILKGTCSCPPFAVIADKLTPTRGTLQVVGIVTFINDKIEPLLIDLLPISHHTGLDIAKYIYKSLEKHYKPTQIKSNCVGGAFDGQYFI
jgi:hypothetical protein